MQLPNVAKFSVRKLEEFFPNPPALSMDRQADLSKEADMSKINPYTAKLFLGTSFILAISLTSCGFAQSGNGQFPGSQPPPSKMPTQELPNQLPKIVQKSDANNNESGFPKLPDNFPPIKTSDQVSSGVPWLFASPKLPPR